MAARLARPIFVLIAVGNVLRIGSELVTATDPLSARQSAHLLAQSA
jgi:hypothetical protein